MTGEAVVMATRPPDPIVEITGGRLPERGTVVRLEGFDGPLALLLSLIEARQLDVLDVPLGALASAYLDALAGLEVERLANVSAFIAIASQLILIKSRAMLPRQVAPVSGDPAEDAPDPEAELRARLIAYRTYRDAALRLQASAMERAIFRREPSSAPPGTRTYAPARPVVPLDPSILRGALEGIARLAPPAPPPPETVRRTIRIEDRAEIIRAALRSVASIVLQELLEGVRDRVVRAVTFLALLELVKRREVSVEQLEPWGPIVATRVLPRTEAS